MYTLIHNYIAQSDACMHDELFDFADLKKIVTAAGRQICRICTYRSSHTPFRTVLKSRLNIAEILIS